MQSYTFEILKDRKKVTDKLYNLFLTTLVDVKNLTKYETIIYENEECRLDLISKRLYGTKTYVEELMIINNIVNPFSIKAGDTFFYVSPADIELMKRPEEEFVAETISGKNKSTRKDPTRRKGVPPTIKPIDFEQVIVDRKAKTIKLNTKLS